MSQLQFYEKVKVLSCPRSPDRVGTFGYVLGVSEEDGVVGAYYVMFPDIERGLSLPPSYLEGTGEIAPRSQFYDEEPPSLRVGVKGGRGYLIEDE